MSLEPLVSVVIPSYNHSNFIEEALQSVINQTYENIEIIVVDDCSTDNSVQIIKKFSDERIIFEAFEKNCGAVDTLNYAIGLAKGKYVALLNSDDVWFKDKLSKQVQYLEENSDVGAVFSDAQFINEHSEVLYKKDFQWVDIFAQTNRPSGAWLRKFFFELNCICHPSMLIRKELYENRKYNPSLRQLPDFKMWIDIIKHTKIYIFEDKLVKFRVLSQDKNSSADTSVNRIRNRNEIYFLMNDFFNEVKLSDFVEGFYDLLINKSLVDEEYSEDLMKCEQAFLYLNVTNEISHIYKLIGIRKLHELLSEDRTRKMLDEKYNFTDKDFFHLTGDFQLLIYGENPITNLVVSSAKKNLEKNRFIYNIIRRIRNYF